MSTNKITEALDAVQHAIEPPTIDRLEIQRRARLARRRRVSGRAAIAGVAAAAVVTGGFGVQQWRSDPGGKPGIATQPRGEYVAMNNRVPLVIERSLVILEPDNSVTQTDVETEEVLGSTDDGVYVIADESRIVFFPWTKAGVGSGIGLAADKPVQRAWLAKGGELLTWQQKDGRLAGSVLPGNFINSVGAFDPIRSDQPEEGVLAADDGGFVTSRGGEVVWHLFDTTEVLDAQAKPRSAEVANGTIALESIEGVQFFDTDGSAVSAGGVGGSVGALSPDGETYASGVELGDIEEGASPLVTLHDVHSGETTDVQLPKALNGEALTSGASQMTWTGANFLVVLTGGDLSAVAECSPTSATCTVRYEAKRDQVQLPTQ